MTETHIQLIDGGGGDAAAFGQLASVSIAPWMFDFGSNITINKTWHANCKKSDVSKILDWLVI
jgi:hypothetical protein